MSRWAVGITRDHAPKYRIFKLILVYLLIFLLIYPLFSVPDITTGQEISNVGEEYIIGAYCEYGKGRCVFYSDVISFINPCFGNKEGNFDVDEMTGAWKFAENIMSWLGRGGKKILIDQSHNQYEPDEHGDGIKEFVDYLEKSEYTVEYYQRWQDDFSLEFLLDYDILLFMGVIRTNERDQIIEDFSFSTSEINKITEFVNMGGGLFIMGCGDDYIGDAWVEISDEIYNPLLTKFGATFNGKIPDFEAWIERTYYDMILEEHKLTENITSLPFSDYTRWISIEEPCKHLIVLKKKDLMKLEGIITVTPKGVISTCLKYNEGRAVFCGTEDPILIMNRRRYESYSQEKLNSAENFTVNLVTWLGRGGKRVLVDQSHNQQILSWGNIEELSGFEKMMIKHNFSAVFNFETIFDPELSYDILKKFDVLILLGVQDTGSYSGAHYRWSYSDNEIKNITEYVSNGGGLLVMTHGQKYDYGASIDIYNKLAVNFGVKFKNNSVKPGERDLDIFNHPLTKNVTDLYLGESCTIEVDDNSSTIISVIVKEETDTFGGIFNLGRLILIFAILMVTLGFMMIRILGTEIGKYKFFTMISPLYSKLRKDKILDNKTRGMIQEHIQSNPGVHYNSIKRELSLSNGVLAYHISTLEREGYITSKKEGMYKILYPQDSKSDGSEPHLSESGRKIYEIIRNSPGSSQKEIAEKSDLTYSTVNYHINSLVDSNLVRLERNGNETYCYPADTSQEAS
jgi:predicted transcriptional regulator/uncharacterized membrane protein